MQRILTIAGLVVAVLLALIFGLDLALGIPFSKVSMLMDILFLVCALMLGYMSWMTLRQVP
ncbi:MAG: hypothetical protein K1X74_13500 [Pirellulales bacterium]|nr:hypothetical protein [Pirellulales bacterium]